MTSPRIADSALPGLATVADEALFLPVLEAAITAIDPLAETPCSMRIVRLRYRPGQRAVFNVEFGYRQTGRQVLPASIWLFAGSKARKRAGEIDCNRPLHEPMTDSLVYFFPADPYVPELAAFTANPQTYAHSLSLVGFDRMVVSRFRPGIGATFCCSRGEDELAYVKIQKNQSARQSVEILYKLQNAAKEKSFAIPTLAGLDERISAFSMRAAQGTSFGDIVARGSLQQLGLSTQRLLRALADLHAIDLTSDRTFDRNHLISQNWESARSIASLVPAFGPVARQLAALLESLPAKLVATACHGDMKPEHAIVSDAGVTLLDLDSFVHCDPLYDLAMLDLRVGLLVAAGDTSAERAELVSSLVGAAAKAAGGSDASHRFHWLKACAALQVGKHHAQKFDQSAHQLVAAALQLGVQSINQSDELSSTAVHFLHSAELEYPPCA